MTSSYSIDFFEDHNDPEQCTGGFGFSANFPGTIEIMQEHIFFCTQSNIRYEVFKDDKKITERQIKAIFGL